MERLVTPLRGCCVTTWNSPRSLPRGVTNGEKGWPPSGDRPFPVLCVAFSCVLPRWSLGCARLRSNRRTLADRVDRGHVEPVVTGRQRERPCVGVHTVDDDVSLNGFHRRAVG